MLKAPQELECIKKHIRFCCCDSQISTKNPNVFSVSWGWLFIPVFSWEKCTSQTVGVFYSPNFWSIKPSIFSQGTYIACSVDSPWNIKSWKTKCCQSLVSTNPAVFRMGFSGRGVFYTPASASGSASGGDFALHVGGWLNQLFEKRCAPSKMGSSFPSNSGENNKTNRWNRKYPVLEFLGLKVLFFWGSWNYPRFDQSGSICG